MPVRQSGHHALFHGDRVCSFFTGAASATPNQPVVELSSERLTIRRTEWRRAAGMQSAGTHGVEEIAHAESCSHVIGGEEFSARAERESALRYDLGGQRDVAGDDQVFRACPPDNLVVSDIEP